MACTRSHSELAAQQRLEFRLYNSQPILSSLQCSSSLRCGPHCLPEVLVGPSAGCLFRSPLVSPFCTGFPALLVSLTAPLPLPACAGSCRIYHLHLHPCLRIWVTQPKTVLLPGSSGLLSKHSKAPHFP